MLQSETIRDYKIRGPYAYGLSIDRHPLLTNCTQSHFARNIADRKTPELMTQYIFDLFDKSSRKLAASRVGLSPISFESAEFIRNRMPHVDIERRRSRYYNVRRRRRGIFFVFRVCFRVRVDVFVDA